MLCGLPWHRNTQRSLQTFRGLEVQSPTAHYAPDDGETDMDRRTAISMIGLSLAAEQTVARDAPVSAAGIKLIVLYGHPPNPEEFEKYYLGIHMPLVHAIRGSRRMEAAKCLPQADGSPPAFYRIFEMWFDSPEEMAAVFATPQGMKVRADVANFTAGTTVTRLVCKLD